LNRYLVADLETLNVWNNNSVEYIRVKNGSIQGLSKYVVENSSLFPDFTGNMERLAHIEKKYKTMWEIPQRLFLKMSADRGRYVDQSASTNIYIRDCTDEKLKAAHLYGNMLGLKTLMYYFRQTGGETIKFTADPSMIQHIKGTAVEVSKEEKKPEEKKPEDLLLTTGTFTVTTKKELVCNDEICVSCT
jgi:ribonucleotide reductase alpha subunit